MGLKARASANQLLATNVTCGRSNNACVQGFSFLDDAKPGSSSQKWGFIATQAGARLVLAVNTTAPAHSVVNSSTVSLYLAYLVSYEHMGNALVE
jgi:hypothetical protein